MFGDDPLMTILGTGVLGAPLVLVAILGIASLIGRPLAERTTSRLVVATIFTGLLASLGIAGIMVVRGETHRSLEFGQWINIPDVHFHFSVKFLFDRLSLPFVILAYVLTGTIGGFANRYMHRESGYNRFFFLYALFIAGMTLTSLAGTIETLFAGWELVGLSSALLVAFYQERVMPVRNGLRVWIVYRVSDAALLIAAVVMHHYKGEGDFDHLAGAGVWPIAAAELTMTHALAVGLLLLLAAAGKSALIPFSGWLPRAMEGPTPSSAVFYGAISVHLGAFLLLRVSPLLDASPTLSIIVTILGLATAMFAALAGRVQTDIKSALSFASVTQVGIIVAEIGLGFRYLALAHIIGHASLRTLQYLRAPTILQDYHSLESAIGSRLPHRPTGESRWLPPPIHLWLYRFSLERGHLDSFLDDFIARPTVAVFRWCDRMERRWTRWLNGPPNPVAPSSNLLTEPIDELS